MKPLDQPNPSPSRGSPRPSRRGWLSVFRDALRNRCPACGDDRVFDGPWRMRHHCAGCRYVYERESGYFLGAIYVNYGFTALVCLAVFFGFHEHLGRSIGSQLAYVVPLAILVPVLFFRYSRLLWMALDVSCSPPGCDDRLGPPSLDPETWTLSAGAPGPMDPGERNR